MHNLCNGVGLLHSFVRYLSWILISLVGIGTAAAQPAQISLQGLLTDPGGTSIAGPVNMTVRLYADSVGGAPFFTEVHNSLPLSDGVYNIRLGTINNLYPDTFAKRVWMGIQVNADPEITPRTLFTAAPASMTLVLPTKLVGTASNYGGTTLTVQNLATTGQNYALTGLSSSTNGRALYGLASHTTGLNYGVYGASSSSAGVGVRGRNSATSGATIGVEGVAESTSGDAIGVKGTATASVTGIGVKGEGAQYGVAGSSSGIGGKFDGNTGFVAHGSILGGAVDGNSFGLRVRANTDANPDLILEGVGRISSDPLYYVSSIKLSGDVDIVIDNTGTFTILDDEANTRLSIAPVDISLYLDPQDLSSALFRIFSPSGNVFQVDESGSTTIAGDLVVVGAKNAQVETPSYGNRLVYSIESPEVWFEDFGTAELSRGWVRIDLDPIFLETVTISAEYPMKVFLQPGDDTPGLYVEKDATGFSVFERSGGSGAVTFDYRVVAKRRGFESERLEVPEAPEATR